MSDNRYRWQARIGSQKGLAFAIGLVAVFGVWLLALKLQTALRNPAEPQSVPIGQVIRGEIGPDRYIQVVGVAQYAIAYSETDDDKLVATIHAVIDPGTGDLLFVRTTQPVPDLEQRVVTLAGITRASPTDLRAAIEADLPALEEAGLATTSSLYLAAGERPGNPTGLILAIAGLSLLLLLCAATAFFPGTVFRPQPVAADAGPGRDHLVTKATGRFQRLNKLEPSIEVGRGTHRFREANANLVPLEPPRLMVYVRFVQSQGAYGITLHRQKSDWAVLLDPARVRPVEPGKLLGWRDRWAIRIQYQDDKDKPQALILSFDDPAAQAAALGALRQMGFAGEEV